MEYVVKSLEFEIGTDRLIVVFSDGAQLILSCWGTTGHKATKISIIKDKDIFYEADIVHQSLRARLPNRQFSDVAREYICAARRYARQNLVPSSREYATLFSIELPPEDRYGTQIGTAFMALFL